MPRSLWSLALTAPRLRRRPPASRRSPGPGGATARRWPGALRRAARCLAVLIPSALVLIETGYAGACSVLLTHRAITAWPAGDGVPLNARFQVRFPERLIAAVVPPVDAVRQLAQGASEADPVARLAQALSLRTELSDGAPGAKVATGWRAVIDPEAWTFELSPLAPLLPRTAYVIVVEEGQASRRIVRLRTGLVRAEAPPGRPGIRAARFVAASNDECLAPCCFADWHGPQARLVIDRVAATGPHRFLAWLARREEPLRYDEAPARVQERNGELWIDLPRDLARVARVRIGVRAADGAGNLSPPAEAEVAPVLPMR